MRGILFLCAAFAAAASWPVHAQNVGERFQGHISIPSGMNTTVQVPLPEGEWLVLSKWNERTQPSNVRLLKLRLVQVADGALRGFISITTNDEMPNVGWKLPEYCSRKDLFFKVPDDTRGMGDGRPFNCVAINHFQMTGGPKSGDATKELYDWTWKNTKGMPVTMIDAIFELSDGKRFLEVFYARNPESEGFDAPPPSSWRSSVWHRARLPGDPKKLAYVESVRDWALAWRPRVEAGFNGKLALR